MITIFIRITLTPNVQISEDLQFTFPQSNYSKLRVAAKLDPIESPFVVIPTADWNRLQQKIDEVGKREEFHALGLHCWLIKQSGVLVQAHNQKG